MVDEKNPDSSKKKCGALTVAGGNCRRAPMRNGRCPKHGGLTPVGPASPHWKDGRHSKYLPTRLVARAKAAANDPEILNLASEIALHDARIMELLGRLDTGESGAIWKALRKAHEELLNARRKGDADAVREGDRALGMLIEQGYNDSAAWAEILSVVELRRSCVSTEMKRRRLLMDFLSKEQVMAIGAALQAIFRRHVIDVPTRQAIAAEIAHVLNDDERARTSAF